MLSAREADCDRAAGGPERGEAGGGKGGGRVRAQGSGKLGVDLGSGVS